MDVTRNKPTESTGQEPKIPSGQESTARLVAAFRGPLFGLDTEALAKAVSHFRYPEKTAADITQYLEKNSTDPLELNRFERDMAQAMETRFEPKRVFGIAVGPFLETVADLETHKQNALAGTAAMAQALGGAGQIYLGAELGFTPARAFLWEHGVSNFAGGIADLADIIDPSGEDRDWNLVRQGYENMAEMVGADKSVGTTVHTMVGVVTAGCGLLAGKEVVKNAGSALSYRTQVTAAETASALELSSEVVQAADTVFEANRQSANHAK